MTVNNDDPSNPDPSKQDVTHSDLQTEQETDHSNNTSTGNVKKPKSERAKELLRRRRESVRESWTAFWGYLFPGDLLVLAAGADPSWFQKEGNDSEEELRRFRTQGAIVCLTATFATLGALYFFSFVFREPVLFIGPNVLTVLFALVWGAMIFFLDRLMLQTMLGEEGRKWRPALARIALAVVIGLVIAHPLKLQIFKPVLEAKYNSERQAYFLDSARTAKAAREELRRRIVPEGASEADIQSYIVIDQFLRRSERVISRTRNYLILESEGVSGDDLGRPAQIELPLSSFQLDIVLSRSPGCSSSRWVEVEELNEFEQDYRDAELDLNKAYPNGESSARERARSSTNEILRRIPNVTRYRLGSTVANPKGIENCALFQWVLDQWESAYGQAESDQIDLAIGPAVVAELETNLAEFNDLTRASRRLSVCSEPMQGYTIADQRADERRLRENNIDPSIYADAIFSVDSATRNPREEAPGNQWAAYLCASRYPQFSFIWQTDLLFRLGGGSSQILQLSNFGKNLTSIGISLLFIMMEILPVLSKLFTKPGPYELDVARRIKVARERFNDGPTLKTAEEIAEEQERATAAKFRNQRTEDAALAYLALDRRVKQKKAELLLDDNITEEADRTIRRLEAEMNAFVDQMDPRTKKLLFE